MFGLIIVFEVSVFFVCSTFCCLQYNFLLLLCFVDCKTVTEHVQQECGEQPFQGRIHASFAPICNEACE